jgi:hypothetical protein
VKIQMEPTELITDLDGVECRLWNAVTERGTQCFVYAHRIAVPSDGTAHPDDIKEFEELFEGWTPITMREKQ